MDSEILFLLVVTVYTFYRLLHVIVIQRTTSTSKKKKKKRYVCVAGHRVSAVKLVSPYHIVDMTQTFARKTYSTEKEFLEYLDTYVKRCFCDVDHFEIDFGSHTRIYRQGTHPNNRIGFSEHASTPPVKKAYVCTSWLFNCRIDVTDRINTCAGPRGDFFTGVGGFVRPMDLLLTVRPCFWNTLCIEWNNNSGATMVGKHDLLTVDGKLYPDVAPFTPSPLHAKKKTSLFSKLKKLL